MRDRSPLAHHHGSLTAAESSEVWLCIHGRVCGACLWLRVTQIDIHPYTLSTWLRMYAAFLKLHGFLLSAEIV